MRLVKLNLSSPQPISISTQYGCDIKETQSCKIFFTFIEVKIRPFLQRPKQKPPAGPIKISGKGRIFASYN